MGRVHSMLAVMLVLLFSSVAVAQQAQTKPDGKDYLVWEGKHPVWASTLKAKPGAPEPAPVAKGRGDYLVTVGKQQVWASSLRRPKGAKTQPAAHDKLCRDYLVEIGKRVVRASQISAPCRAGVHKGEMKPLCCVASVSDAKKMPWCCREAQGK